MKKRILTRKARALRWLLAVVLLAVLAWVLLPWSLTPEAAHDRALEYRNVGETEIVHKMESPLDWILLFSMNDQAVAMGGYRREHWFHWSNYTGVDVVEREAGRPFATGYLRESVYKPGPDKDVDYYYVFGVVQDESVSEILIEFDAIEGGHDQEVILTEEDWLVTDTGDRYFLVALEPEIDNGARAIYATGYLADGSATQTYWMTGAWGWK